jgi:hypothetical protein
MSLRSPYGHSPTPHACVPPVVSDMLAVMLPEGVIKYTVGLVGRATVDTAKSVASVVKLAVKQIYCYNKHTTGALYIYSHWYRATYNEYPCIVLYVKGCLHWANMK